MKKLIQILFITVAMLLFQFQMDAQCNFLNGGFETWQIDTIPTQSNDTIYYENPSNWVSFVDQFGALFAPNAASFVPKVNKTTDKNSGTYAVRLDADDGESSDLESYGFCNTRPNKLTGFFKFNGNPNDTFLVSVYMIDEDPVNFLFSGDTSTAIGQGSFLFIGTQSAYQQFSINVNYKSAAPADTFVIQVANINSVGFPQTTSAYIDDFNLFLSNGVNEVNGYISYKVYPNPNNGKFNLSFSDLDNAPDNIEIFNSIGQIVYENDVISNLVEIELNQPKGVYFVRMISKKGILTERIVIN